MLVIRLEVQNGRIEIDLGEQGMLILTVEEIYGDSARIGVQADPKMPVELGETVEANVGQSATSDSSTS